MIFSVVVLEFPNFENEICNPKRIREQLIEEAAFGRGGAKAADVERVNRLKIEEGRSAVPDE